MGNNYESAIIVAQNALKDFPYSKYKEDFDFIVLKAKFQEAKNSIDEKKGDRYREVVDEYYDSSTTIPTAPTAPKPTNILAIAKRHASE